MEEACERAANRANSYGWVAIYSAIVSENSMSLWKKESIIVITDYALTFFKKDTIELNSAFLWINIQSLSLNSSEVEIKFRSKKITISTFLFAKQIYTAISLVIANILSNGELKRIKLSQLQIKRKMPSSYAAIVRMMQEGSGMDPQILKATTNELRQILVPKKPFLSSCEFKNAEYVLPYIIKVLKFCTYLKSLRIDHQQQRQSPYEAVIQNSKYLKKLQHLAICGKRKKFGLFCEKLSKTSNELYALAFKDSLFTPEQVVKLAQLITSKGITSLQLFNAMIPTAVQCVTNNLLTPSVSEILCVLRIEDTPNINLESLFSKLPPKLVSLSLAKNEIYVEDVFNLLNYIPSSLRILDLSQNICQRMPLSALTLPDTIGELRLANIKWTDISLSNLFQLIWRRGNLELRLDLSNALASDSEWERVFKEFATAAVHPFIALRWDYNPVSGSIFRFLTDSIGLTELRMNGCFKDGDDFSCLCDLLTISQSLKLFQSRGVPSRSSSNFMLPVIKAATDSQTLETFDISGNQIGDEGLRLLESLIQYSPISVLSFDGAKPSKGALMSLMDLSYIHKETIKVSFPSKDIEWLMKEGKMKGTEAHDLTDRFRIRESEQPFESFILKFPFSAPFHIFQYYDWNPSFLSQEEAEKMRSHKPGPVKKPEPRTSTPMRAALPEPVVTPSKKETFLTPHPSEIQLSSDSEPYQKVTTMGSIKTNQISKDESSESDIPIIMPPKPTPDYTIIKPSVAKNDSEPSSPPISPLRPTGSFRSRTRTRTRAQTKTTPSPIRSRNEINNQVPSTTPRKRRSRQPETPKAEDSKKITEHKRTRTQRQRAMEDKDNSKEKTETIIGSKVVGVSSITENDKTKSSLNTLHLPEAAGSKISTLSTGYDPSFDRSPERVYSPTKDSPPNPYNPSIRSPKNRRSPATPTAKNKSVVDAIDAMLEDAGAWSPSYVEGSFQNVGELGSMSSFSQKQNSSVSSLAEVFGTQERTSPRGSILMENSSDSEPITVESLYGARIKKSPQKSPPNVKDVDGDITIEQLYGSRVGRK